MWLAGEACQYADMPPREVHAGTDVLIAIADGVATSPTPARASLLTVQSLVERLQAQPEWSFDGLLGTRHVRAAQAALCDALASRRLAWGASTTLVAAHLRGNHLAIVNSGDSRAYLIRANGDTTQLSRDHTVAVLDRRPPLTGSTVASTALLQWEIDLPLTAIDDFAKAGETDPMFAELDRICKAHNGLWSAEAEKYLLANK